MTLAELNDLESYKRWNEGKYERVAWGIFKNGGQNVEVETYRKGTQSDNEKSAKKREKIKRWEENPEGRCSISGAVQVERGGGS